MFQPTNESYVRSLVESTIDRHMGESEVERVLRQEQPCQESSLSNPMRGFLAAVGHVLHGIGERLENVKTPDAVLSHRQTASRRTSKAI